MFASLTQFVKDNRKKVYNIGPRSYFRTTFVTTNYLSSCTLRPLPQDVITLFKIEMDTLSVFQRKFMHIL
jgi:hypothetical protein